MGILLILLHQKVILFYESDFFFGGGGGGGRRSGLILGILFKKQNMGSNEVKWTSIEMDYMTPKTPENMYHTHCFMNT